MTSKAALIYNALLADFPESMKPITELSQNTAQGASKFRDFIICHQQAFNFDNLKNQRPGMKPHKEQTPDALFLHNDKLYFVEFKEGKNVDKTDVRQKIHEGLITLYQYCAARNLVTRQEFVDLRIRYAVIYRQPFGGAPPKTVLTTLQQTQVYFNLQNIEGLLVEKTMTNFLGDHIFKFLQKVSNGHVKRIAIMDQAQQFAEFYQ